MATSAPTSPTLSQGNRSKTGLSSNNSSSNNNHNNNHHGQNRPASPVAPSRSPLRSSRGHVPNQSTSSFGNNMSCLSLIQHLLPIPFFFLLGHNFHASMVHHQHQNQNQSPDGNHHPLSQILGEFLQSSSSSSSSSYTTYNRNDIQRALHDDASWYHLFRNITIVHDHLPPNFTHIPNISHVDLTQNWRRIRSYAAPQKTATSGTTPLSNHQDVYRGTQTNKNNQHPNNQNPNNPHKQSQQQQQQQQHSHSSSSSRTTDNNNNDEPLNIVLFYGDDWTMDSIGAMNPHVMTPNIDDMADRGMLFTQNCVTTSICWISRNTMMTGVYSAVHQTTSLQDEEMFNQTVPWLDTLYPLLKRNGYHTGFVGKWHAPQPPEFMVDTFDKKQLYFGHHWFDMKGNRRQHVTDLNGQHALAFLRNRPKHKRFALTVSFFATHAVDQAYPPYQPMPESMPLYVNDTIPRPKTATEKHWQDMPYFFTNDTIGRRRRQRRFDDESYPTQIKNLYRMATEADAVIGAVMDELKEQGVYNNTLLVFTTDNGVFHGEHGLAEKWFPYREAIQVPLVIQDPRMPMEFVGTRNDDFTLSVDVAPTLLSAARIEIPQFMQGRDMAQLYLNPAYTRRTWRQDFFYEWNQGHPMTAANHYLLDAPPVFALIRKDYKYFYWPHDDYEQLFQVERDPYEEVDIVNATSRTTQHALELMRARYAFLKQWAQSGNPV